MSYKFPPSDADEVLTLDDITKTYFLFAHPTDRIKQWLFGPSKTYYEAIKALHSTTFSVKRGETVAIIGKNGSGKSTLLQIIAGTLPPTSGTLKLNGKIAALLELGSGFNPEFTGIENIHINAAILGLTKPEIEGKLDSIIQFSGIGDAIYHPVKTYSSGMFVRLAYAVTTATNPDILIVDEALAVGDERFQRKCFAHMEDFRSRGGTILFVSHSMPTVLELCNRAILIDQGEILLDASPKQVVSLYHKLLFAPTEHQLKIREAIRSQTAVSADTNFSLLAQQPIGETVLESHFDPSLIPETTISYQSSGAEILNVSITDMDGKPVNMLLPRHPYKVDYVVRFDHVAPGLMCGMMIKTKSGVHIGGKSTLIPTDICHTLVAGSHLNVSFTFTCLLAPDIYFLNCGCSGTIGQESTFLHRIVDAAAFKVLPEIDISPSGIVDFLIEPSFTLAS
ncbi:MAG: ABC transporter ATP-binding protein [Alphaproteobacteria bacterium]|nr:ABC transporter ATP-binding protein [Alphaproteobacteria bacterium]